MVNIRIHGNPPYTIAAVHGGPGAAGEMAPVAQRLSANTGVLEPLQTAGTVEGQIAELHDIIVDYSPDPIILAGFSWGAWLSFMVAARYPNLVRRLILISSGPFEEKYAGGIMHTRLSRLKGKEQREALALINTLHSPATSGKDSSLARLGSLLFKADSYDPLAHGPDAVKADYSIHRKVWEEAWNLRKSGRLFTMAAGIRCPVIAIHGDYDPHPTSGVREPLTAAIKEFTFILLSKCGHYPWLEKEACAEFYRVLGHQCGTGI